MFLRITQSSLLISASIMIASCGHRSPDYNPDIGPFDEDGNYVEAWADNPPKRRKSSRTTKTTKPEPAPAPVVTSKPTPPPVVSSKPKATPKPVYKPQPKPKPKPPVKPKPSYKTHTIVKGDTLYGLSRKYGTSVSSIQKANGISGSNIRIGQTLRIPNK